MDTPRSSCAKCEKPLPAGVGSGLCTECSATHASSGTISRVVSSVVGRIRTVFRVIRKRLGLTPRETSPRQDEATTLTLPAGQGRNPSPPTGAVTKSAPLSAADTPSGSIHISDMLRPFGLSSTGNYSNDIDNISTADPPSRPPLPMPPHPPGYELVGEISRGGMGVVYLAFERAAPDQKVAIKYLMDSADVTTFKRFQGEMRLWRLKSENVARILTSNADAGRPYIVMELAGGGTLAGRVKAGGPLDPWLAARWVRDVALAVAEAHERHVIHRDIKPGNILLARRDKDDAKYVRLHGQPKPDAPFRPDDYFPKLSDFGLAKRLGGSTGVTVGSAAMGTAPYMPPEQVKNPQAGDEDERVGVRSDVYSLGATLYHLVCGRAPFVGESPASVMLDVMHREPPLPRKLRPELPWQLEAIIVKAMEKKPRNRYQTAQELADDLAAFCERREIRARRVTRARRAWRAMKRNVVAVAAVLVAAGLFAAGAVWAARPPQVVKDEPPPDPLKVLENKLAAAVPTKSSVEIIKAKGYPEWHNWVLGETKLVASDIWPGTIRFFAQTMTVLELVRDPMTDRYRVEVELCHENHTPDRRECVGLFLGLDQFWGVNGAWARRVVSADYSDFPAEGADKFPQVLKHHAMSIRDFTFRQARAGNWVEAPGRELKSRYFAPQPRENLWRGIAADVRPDGITFWWRDDPKLDWQLGPYLDAKTLDASRRVAQQYLDEDMPNSGVILEPWSPRRPLGILARASWVGIRNVVLTPQ